MSNKIKVEESWLQQNGLYKCPECEVEKTKYGIGGHIWMKHGNGKKRNFNSFEKFLKEKGCWNKGLTKETDERVRKFGISLSKSQKGLPGTKHSEETKQKISKARTEYLFANPDKVPYRVNHSSKESYPERIFKEALIKNEIIGWVQEYQNGIYSYDFAFIDLKIDIEIDGGTHLSEKVKIIDKRRDEWSNINGWVVLRFPVSEIKSNLDFCIEKLKLLIKERTFI